MAHGPAWARALFSSEINYSFLAKHSIDRFLYGWNKFYAIRAARNINT